MGTNRYFGWSEKKRRGFIYDLALVASESATPMGASTSIKWHQKSGLGINPFEDAITKIFESFSKELSVHFNGFDGKALFIFDRCDDKNWILPLHKVHSVFAEKDPRIGGLTFEDDKDPKHSALQAADLLSYSFRQQAERCLESGTIEVPLKLLHVILMRNIDPALRDLLPAFWHKFVVAMIEDEKIHKEKWAKAGHPREVYYPERHFNFERYGFKKTNPDAV
jgi:hypothetical protein